MSFVAKLAKMVDHSKLLSSLFQCPKLQKVEIKLLPTYLVNVACQLPISQSTTHNMVSPPQFYPGDSSCSLLWVQWWLVVLSKLTSGVVTLFGLHQPLPQETTVSKVVIKSVIVEWLLTHPNQVKS